ncbi:hypothetical protein SAMN05216567_106425 [Variovorax sp. OK605]|uniref:hypothetical protein n=1 Tax=Variovorax sp. OK605 TaxID=1855317 RepID=UPI0008EF171F|nr:hypothetical protein [Variovorax sp. OK605]SFP50367.1 hypothetical protein SAMN05216567_106425 [Variovorax sp. OK605]
MLRKPSSWVKRYSAHVAGRAEDVGVPVVYSHAQEVVSAGGGAKSYAAIKTGGHPAATSMPSGYDAEQSEKRVSICANLDRSQKEELLRISEAVFEDGENPNTALAWLLAEHLVNDCEQHPSEGFVGSVLLTEELVQRAGEVASSDEFSDFLYESLPWPSIAPLAYAKPDKSIDGHCMVEPGAVLNVIAYLVANCDHGVEDVLRYSKRLAPGLRRAH